MRIVKVGVLAPTNKGVPLGVQGESCATEVEFDVRPWLREYPSGTVSAVARREGDPAPYPLTLDVADGMAVWIVSDTDTAKAGEGAVELTLTSGGTRVRSLTFKTLVTASLTDAPVDDDAWYGWLDKAVVKVDETVQAAQRKLTEVDQEWTGLKADVNAKVDECSKAAAQAAEDAHRAKVDAQATAKALESAEGSTAKAEAAAKRAEDAAGQAEGAAGQAEGAAGQAATSEENASAAVTAARLAQGQAEGYASEAGKSARDAMASQVSANDSAGAAADAAADAGEAAANAEKARAAADEAKAAAAVSEGNAATSASDAAESASAAAKSASDAAASVDAINVIAPKAVADGASSNSTSQVVIGNRSAATANRTVVVGQDSAAHSSGSIAIGSNAHDTDESNGGSVAVGDNANVKSGAGLSAAIGSYSTAIKNNEFSIGYPPDDDRAEYTREITHVSTPTEPSSAATKGYVDNINIISPTHSVDAASGRDNGLAWGGASKGVDYGIAIGDHAVATGHSSVAIGSYATAVAKNSTAIGDTVFINFDNVIAIGRPDVKREVWYVNTPTRDHSAATKGYVDNLVASANMVRGSNSITVADGTAKVNPAIFGDGLSVTDGQVSVDLDHVGEHLAGDALYYDQTDGLMLKVGQGLHIQNDELDIDQANLPLASAGVRGTVRVGSGLAIDTDGVLSATGGGAGSGYGKLAKATLKTTERVSGIADGEDDVVTDADVPCAVGEMDGTLFLTSAPAYRVLRTTYTTGTVMHLEFEWLVDDAQLDPSMLTHAVLSLGNASTLVPATTRSVNGKRYKSVEYTATSDIKAGMSVSLKFI